ncbi:hypothetical protein KKE99_02290 [Patescibacteria group bacterium]|nr:hypothetical protein [Patescibacteria group bacterium]
MKFFSRKILNRIFKFIFLILAFILLPFFSYAATAPLSGYAWSENAGWISFAPSGGGVLLDDTGDFSGYAWGENIGWVSFNCLNTASCATSNFKVSVPLVMGGVCPACRSCPVCETVSCPLSDIFPPVVSEISIASISQNSAQIAWKTNENADSIVEYGVDTSYKFLTGNPGDISTKVLLHNVSLKNLLYNTAYYFKIISRDSSGNIFTSADQTFKTLPSDDPDDPDVPDIPDISDGPDSQDDLQFTLPEEAIVQKITSFSASISWQTNKPANSLARIKLENAPESAWLEIGDTSAYIIDHLVTLAGLKADTFYQYRVKSSNSSGSTALSKIKIFKTKPAPVISDVLVSDITLDSAVVSWKTNIASTSAIDYGLSTEYGLYASGGSKDFTTTHEIKLKNLKSGATYHFKVKGNDDNDNLIISDNYSFKTYALPLINEYNVEDIKDSSVVVKWTSNIDIDSLVIYSNLKTGESRTQGDTKLSQSHNLKLENLDSGADYVIKIEGRDIFGNAAKGPDIKIKTLLDENAPEITNVRTYANMMSVKGKAQIVVVWKTDEQSTSQVFLFNVANTTDPVYSSAFDSNLTTNHTVIITDLNTDTSYRLRIESADKSGNSGLSQDFAVLTPKEKKSIIMMIIENLERIFGWIKKLNL